MFVVVYLIIFYAGVGRWVRKGEDVKLYVLTEMFLKITASWDVMPCSFVAHYLLLGGITCTNLRNMKNDTSHPKDNNFQGRI